MSPTHFRRLILSLLGVFAIDAAAMAQRHPTSIAGLTEAVSSAAPLCGTYRMQRFDHARALARTAARSPELHRQAMAEAKGTAPRLQSAEEAKFWAPDYETFEYIQVNAVRVHQGRFARIWVDVRDTGRSTLKAKLPTLIKALEDSTAPGSRNPGKGIIENDIEVFGPAPTTVGDGVQDFLLFDIADQGILGFFTPLDQTHEPYSNRRNLLYIDSREGMSSTSSILNTLAHEFQHVIHYGQNEYADLFLNEGCSEVAGLMCGYPDRRNASYLRNTNVWLFDFPPDQSGGNQAYERAFTLMHYLYEQFGEAFMREIPRSPGFEMELIEETLRRSQGDSPLATWKHVGSAFAVANWVQSGVDARYAYKVNITSPAQRRAKPLRTYTSTSLRAHDTVELAEYGIAYVVYEGPGVVTMSFDGMYDHTVTALGISGDNVEVIDVAENVPVTFGARSIYERVVLVFTELSSYAQRITWSVTPGLSGAGDADVPAATRFVRIAPNPAGDRGELHFTTAGTAPVAITLHAVDGTAVRMIVDGESLPPGEHRRTLELSGLAAGVYLARLSQGDATATQVVVVR